MSNPTGKHYTIRRVGDLMDVPSDRLPLCLIELGEAISLSQVIRQKQDDNISSLPLFIRLLFGRILRIRLKTFHWIDDGKFTADVTAISPLGKRRKIRLSENWTITPEEEAHRRATGQPKNP